ncbi:hypothetical protein [Rhodococcus wratislaviensis]|uniref:hypothetical protein n=1 Tax=Rhodococcus wratislaviensis TaxID=44752 RepID=UPI003660F47D
MSSDHHLGNWDIDALIDTDGLEHGEVWKIAVVNDVEGAVAAARQSGLVEQRNKACHRWSGGQ